MTEDSLIITIQKVDKDTETAEALLGFVKSFSWEEVKEHTVRVIKNWEFKEWETPFVAMTDGCIVGMVTIMESDYYPLPEIFPWISTLFVSEEYRGKRISKKLIDFANEYAKGIGFDKTYIPSVHIGLYEKYGYTYIKDIVNYGGDIDRLYGRKGLLLLCETAKANGIRELYDDIAIDNSSVALFLKCGFVEVLRTTEYVLVKKEL